METSTASSTSRPSSSTRSGVRRTSSRAPPRSSRSGTPRSAAPKGPRQRLAFGFPMTAERASDASTAGMKGAGHYDAHSEYQRRVIEDGEPVIRSLVDALDLG